MSSDDDAAKQAKLAAAGQQRKAAVTGDPKDQDQAKNMQSAADRLVDSPEEKDAPETQYDG